jgi:hypothetical protein
MDICSTRDDSKLKIHNDAQRQSPRPIPTIGAFLDPPKFLLDTTFKEYNLSIDDTADSLIHLRTVPFVLCSGDYSVAIRGTFPTPGQNFSIGYSKLLSTSQANSCT